MRLVEHNFIIFFRQVTLTCYIVLIASIPLLLVKMKEITKFYKRIAFNFKNKINLDIEDLNHKSLNELFNHYGTDKGTEVLNPYSKESNELHGHGFAKFYEKEFKHYKNKKFNFLEIGTWEGASSAAFANYFPNAIIYCIDKNFRFKFKSKRITFFNCDINNKKDMNRFSSKFNNINFKIIVDDASHLLSDMIKSLKFFFKQLDSDGIFVIEDFNAPVYFDELNDTKGKELFMKNLLTNITKKKKFKSNILSNSDQEYLFKKVKNIKIFKGKTKISDIAFITKK